MADQVSVGIDINTKDAVSGLNSVILALNDLNSATKAIASTNINVNTAAANSSLEATNKILVDILASFNDLKKSFSQPLSPQVDSGFAANLTAGFTSITASLTSFLNPFNLIPNVVSLVSSAFSGLVSIISTVGSAIGTVLMAPFQLMASAFNAGISVITSVGSAFSSLLFNVGNLGQTMQALQMIFSPFINMLTSAYSAILNMISVTTNFDNQMSKVGSVVTATTADLELMRQAAIKIGADTPLSASQAAEALYQLGSAGMNAKDSVAALNGTAMLAVSTQSDLASSAQLVATSITQFKLQASDALMISNLFTAAINQSQLNMDRLSYSLKYIGPIAGNLGISINEVVGALALLSNAGIMGEQAGTTMREALTKMINPTKELKQALTEAGLSIDAINPQTVGLVNALNNLQKLGLTTSESMKIFGDAAGPGMLALLNQGSGALDNMISKVSNTDAAMATAKMQMDNLYQAIEQLSGAYESLSIVLGGVAQKGLQIIVQALTDMVATLTDVITKSEILNTLSDLFISVSTIAVDAIKQITAVLNTDLLKSLTEINNSAKAATPTIIAFFNSFINSSSIASFISIISSGVSSITEFAATFVSLSASLLSGNFDTAFKQISDGIQSILNDIVNFIGNNKTVIETAMSNMWESLKSVTSSGLNSLSESIKSNSELINSAAELATEFIKSFGEGITKAIPEIFKGISDSFSELNNSVTSVDGNVLMKPIIEAFKQGFTILKTVIAESIKGLSTALDFIGLSNDATSKLKSLFDNMKNAVMSNDLISAFKLLFQSIKVVFEEFRPAIEQGLKDLTDMVVNQLKNDFTNNTKESVKSGLTVIADVFVAGILLWASSGVIITAITTSLTTIAAAIAAAIAAWPITIAVALLALTAAFVMYFQKLGLELSSYVIAAIGAVGAAIVLGITGWPAIILGALAIVTVAIFDYVSGGMSESTKQAFQIMFDTIIEFFKISASAISTAFSSIFDFLTGFGNELSGKGSALGSALIDGITGALSVGATIIKGIIDGIMGGINAMINQVMHAINNLKSAAAGAKNLVTTGTLAGGDEIKLGANMTQMATGGIIKSSNNGTIVRAAEAGMNEAFVPLPNGNSIPVSFNEMPEMATASNYNNSVNINFGDVMINNQQDEKAFFNKIEKTINNVLTRVQGRR
jgi:TP901 family phage tail tape measure protein